MCAYSEAAVRDATNLNENFPLVSFMVICPLSRQLKESLLNNSLQFWIIVHRSKMFH